MTLYVTPSYSYAAPLERWLRLRGLETLPAPPREALGLIQANRASAGMVPLGSLIGMEDVRPCPGPMVYSEYSTLSVAIVSNTATRLRDCPRIAVTSETRTSILYLLAVLDELGTEARVVPASTHRYWELLGMAPCALVIGDEALQAIASGARIVADMGELVRDVLGARPVYAATAAKKCPPGITEPPWPKPSWEDALRTHKRTGLDPALSWLYHYELLKLGYDPAALSDAFSLLRDAVSEKPCLVPGSAIRKASRVPVRAGVGRG